MMKTMAREPGKVFSRDDILNRLRGPRGTPCRTWASPSTGQTRHGSRLELRNAEPGLEVSVTLR